MTRFEDDGDDLSLSDLMQMAAENVANGRWTMLPVRVVTYDPARQCVDVQPVVSIPGGDGIPKVMPVIPCCPVAYPAWGGYRVQAPVLPGDLGMLLIASSAMSAWMTTGADGAPPASPRRQSLSDGVYVGGMHAFLGAPGAGGPPTPSTGLRVGATAAWIEITDPGVVLVEAPSIQLGATAVEHLTKWETLLSTSLALIQADLSTITAAVNVIAPASVTALTYASLVPGPQPPITSAATVKVTGE